MARSSILSWAWVLAACASLHGAEAGAPVAKDASKKEGKFYSPSWCASCHKIEYEEWSTSGHCKYGMACYECHGEFHSGTLGGCTRCHEGMHRNRIKNWPAVARFDSPESRDFMCMVCHDAHNSGLKPSLMGCFACHGDLMHGAASDVLHGVVASSLTPVHMDEFARERDGLLFRLRTMSLPAAAGVVTAGAFAGYGAALLVFFPFGLVLAFLWERIRKHKDDPGPVLETSPEILRLLEGEDLEN